MQRGAVLIGVNQTGKLPVLNDAVPGARRMQQWALSQGMAPEHVLLFTDENGPLDAGDIRRAIRKLVESGSLDQLIVYFAGHGVNIRYGEYWLLTDAPVDASAAVNVEGSMVLARHCGIPHVVFISDACRTAAEGVQAQGVTGVEIFPNDPVAGPESPVDIFFAAALGRPALEVRDPAVSTAAFKAIYTTALLDAVNGTLPAVLASARVDGEERQVVRPRPLKAWLLSELPRRLAALRLSADVTQIPDARITSDETAWLASLDAAPRGLAPSGVTRGITGAVSRPTGAPVPATAEARGQKMLRAVLEADEPRPAAPRTRGVPGAPSVIGPVPAAYPPGMNCGFKLVGGTWKQVLSAEGTVELVAGDATLARVGSIVDPVNVLLRLHDGSGVLLPALRGFIASVNFDEGEVIDVAYEPSASSPAWPAFASNHSSLWRLRAVVSETARENSLRLDASLADRLWSRLRYDGHLDPALALYAAYAFHELQMGERVRELATMMEQELGVRFFDMDLLSSPAPWSRSRAERRRVPPLPMLARGWTLLSARGAALPQEVAGIQRHLRPSLWTHFDAEGADHISNLILTRRLQ